MAIWVGLANGVANSVGAVDFVTGAIDQLLGPVARKPGSSPAWPTVTTPMATMAPTPITVAITFALPAVWRELIKCIIFSSEIRVLRRVAFTTRVK
ncbi:hypothetical protein [Mycolicibacterium sp.]|uniref:hypothetical protein n=1 Tax=Mycolicibacterium sp. TaxID=2320850 RepID=UPI0037C8D6E0